MDHINQHATMNTNFSEKAFDAILNNIKLENDSLFNDESSDTEDSVYVPYKSIDNNGTKQQDEMYESASTSFEKNANDESNMQEHTDTELVDGEIISIHAIYPTTALQTMELTSTLIQHTCRQCFWCKKVFRFIDIPSHIGEIHSIDKQNECLKIESSLSVNSCFCAFCWEFLQKAVEQGELSGHIVISSNKTEARKCSIHFCSLPSFYKMSVDQCEFIKKIISTFEYCGLALVQSKNKSSDFLTFPFCLCEVHTTLIFAMSSCQICCSKLNEPLNTDDWLMYEKWNLVLVQNGLPLMLQSGMFICMTCKGYISKINPGFPIDDLEFLRRNIFITNAARLELYGKSQYNFNIRQRSINVASPFVVAKIKDENDYVRSTKVKFSDPLITTTYHYEYGYYKNNTELITSTALLNVSEQNLCTPKLEPIDEGHDVEQHEENSRTLTPSNHVLGHDNNLRTPKLEPIDEGHDVEQHEENSRTLTPSNHVLGHDNNKNLNGDHQLKNYNTNITKNKEINQYQNIVHHNLPKNQYQVDLEIVKNESKIIDSRQIVRVHNKIDNNQSRLNSHIISTGAQDKLKEDSEYMNKKNTNFRTVNLTETDNKMYSFIAAVEPCNVIINPVSMKRKQNNVICHSISNNDVKKQRLNEKYSSCDNNSTNDHTTKSYPVKYIPRPSILNMISKNENVMNSELIAVQDRSNNEESLKLRSNSMKDIKLKTNVPSIEIKNSYGSNPSCSSPLQFKRVLKKISPFWKTKNSSIERIENVPSNISDTESSPDSIILSDSEYLLDSEIRVSDTDVLLDTEIFSESDNEEILSIVDIEETDYMVVVSEGDLDSDSDCEIISNNENSLDVEIISIDNNKLECKESECIIVSDPGEKFKNKKLSTFKVIKTGSDSEILMNHAKIIETYIKNENEKVNYIVAFENEIKPSGDKVSTCIVISDNTMGFDNKKLSTYKIHVEKGSDCKIFLDSEKVKITSEKENKNVIVFNDEIEHSDNKKFKCIIISDNEKEYTNKNICTFKIVSDVQDSLAFEMSYGNAIFGIESGYRKTKYIIMSVNEIESHSDDQSKYMISGNTQKFNNKNLSNSKMVKKNILKGSGSVLLDGEESHEILPNSKNGRIKYMIAPDGEIETDSDEQSDNEEIFSYKKVSDIIITSNGTIEVDDSQGEQSDNEEEFNVKKISDIIIPSNSTIQVNDSQGLKTSDDNNSINNSKINSDNRSSQLQIKSGHPFPYLEQTANENSNHDDENYDQLIDYFKPYLSAIECYFENSDNPLFKELYISLGNSAINMLLYLMENLRMLYLGDLSIADSADEFSKKYLTEQKEILYNYFGDPNHNINASKPFIHPSSHLHKYSKRLSADVGPLIIKNTTITSSSPVQNNSIASKNQTQFLTYSNPNIRFPVAIKKKTVNKNKLKNSQLQKMP